MEAELVIVISKHRILFRVVINCRHGTTFFSTVYSVLLYIATKSITYLIVLLVFCLTLS